MARNGGIYDAVKGICIVNTARKLVKNKYNVIEEKIAWKLLNM